jgi:hypothetical protein
MIVSSASGKTAYSVSPYQTREVNSVSANNGYCLADDGIPGREVNVGFIPGQGKHSLASRPLNTGGVSYIVPGQVSTNIGFYETGISIQPGTTCKTEAPTGNSWTNREYDSRLSGMQDIVLGSNNGIVYIAGLVMQKTFEVVDNVEK